MLSVLCQPLREEETNPLPEGKELGLVPLDVPRVPRDVPPLRYEVKDFTRVNTRVMIGFVIGTVAAIIKDEDSTTFQTSRGTVETTEFELVVIRECFRSTLQVGSPASINELIVVILTMDIIPALYQMGCQNCS